MNPGDLNHLIEDLTLSYPSGTPVLVVVSDYGRRAALVQEIIDEAEVYRVTVHVMEDAATMMQRLPALAASEADAAAVLIDAGTAAMFGTWLEANRDGLPEWVRFIVLLLYQVDVPELARTAPALMSWAKGLEFRDLTAPSQLSHADVARELQALQQETGLTPRQFVEAWRRGELDDSFRNARWLNLAWAATEADPQ